MNAKLRPWSFCLVLVAALSNPLIASTPAPVQVHYHMITEIAPGHREVRFAVAMKLSAHTVSGNDIGWQLDDIALRQPQDPADCPRTWSTTSAVVKTSDNLWWITHADSANPDESEFDVPPLIEGTATSTEPSLYNNLDFDIEGIAGTPAAGHVILNYTFHIVGAPDPEEEEEDDESEGPLPPPEPDYPEIPMNIAPYDLNQDGVTDGLDIDPFIQRALAGCDYDIEEDGPCFVKMLLGESCSSTAPDCNSNSRPDGADILLGVSKDCNRNGIPDECDISSSTSADSNNNSIPDECEPDCNNNGFPDDKDIADSTSTDSNSNSIPDECDPDCNSNGTPDDLDISTAASYDCNGDSIPDECGYDCNSNGIADICDIDASDPDGDGIVAPDCNADGLPDACNLTLLAPFTSFDCNSNGVPDECDIASCGTDLWCQDCNSNGFPDSCDINSGVSQDSNSNQIPDECESQQQMGAGGGGSSMMSTAAMAESSFNEFDRDAAIADLIAWLNHQALGSNSSMSATEHYEAYVKKCRELGLEVVALGMMF